jgi:hypothetical protein
MDGLGEAFFTIAPRLTMTPSASSCRFVSESRAAEKPSLPIVWRKRQIEAWSGVSASSGNPAEAAGHASVEA